MNVKDVKFYIYDNGLVRIEKPLSVSVSCDLNGNTTYYVEVTKEFKTSNGAGHILTYKGECGDDFEFDRVGVIGKDYNQFYWISKNGKNSTQFLTLIKTKLSEIKSKLSETISAIDILLE